ncbi:MAG: bifunctional DNA-formamidopyrimidine glycosylase/DNA-(apurinic or apyrimidinic site) lyase [Burkholderiaceae bacterium]
MPELPEVEIVRRGLTERFVGRELRAVVARRPDLRWPIPPDLDRRLAGRRLRSVERRSKYLMLDFGEGTLIVHLGMSGTLRARRPGEPPTAHDHFDLDFGDAVLRLNDPRRFGAVLWSDSDAARTGAEHPLFRRLGIEPFDPRFGGEWLFAGTRGRRAAIKAMLLAGAIVVGVGNIYACESLFRSGIRPTRMAGRLARARCDRLAAAIRETLADAIEAGGSSLKDFVSSSGESGYFQLRTFVYGRTGQPCLVCRTPIRMIRQQQRASFFCPTCQR